MARKRRQLTIKQILARSDEHRRRTGEWPAVESGPVHGAPGDNWKKIDNTLRLGLRGLEGGSSLVKLLAERRGKWNRKDRPRLLTSQILAWADAHHRRTGQWPQVTSGPIHGVRGENWLGMETALVSGCRGVPAGSTLPQLPARHRDVRNVPDLPPLPTEQILAWVDAF